MRKLSVICAAVLLLSIQSVVLAMGGGVQDLTFRARLKSRDSSGSLLFRTSRTQ